MIFGSLVFFFEGNFEWESPDLVSEIGSTELAAGQPPPVSERHPPRASGRPGGPGPTAPGLSSYDPGCARAGIRDHRVSYPPGV